MAASVRGFNVRTDVDAVCDSTRALYAGYRKSWKFSALEVDSVGEKNPLPHRGLEPAIVLRLGFSFGHSTN